jgi:signal transduction histidine kinase
MRGLGGALRSPRLRALLVSVAIVFAPLGLSRALEPWMGPVDHLRELTLWTLPAAIVLGWWLGWRVVRPLQKLGAQVSQKTDLRGDLGLDRHDEYDELTAAMNALLARLDARQRAHEAFVADAVHALKSPIAAVQVAADQLAEGHPIDGARRERLGRAMQACARRLDEITARLLELARAEAGLPGEAWGPVDVAALTATVVERARSDGRWTAVRVEVEAPAAVVVEGVAARLESALEALLDNARSFAKSRVDMRLEAAAGRIIVAVSDDGPGIEPSERARIFGRFVTGRGDGTGIGLALVRAVAEAHGGCAHAGERAGGGAVVTLELGPRRSP